MMAHWNPKGSKKCEADSFRFCSIFSRDEQVKRQLHAMNLQFQFAEPLIAYLVQVYILATNHSWEDVIVPTHLIRSGKDVEKKTVWIDTNAQRSQQVPTRYCLNMVIE